MTPKEKANELVERFDNEVFDDNDWYVSKQCAIIACDEMIDSEHLTPFTKRTRNILIYWQEVK